jgi:hypothetical protein
MPSRSTRLNPWTLNGMSVRELIENACDRSRDDVVRIQAIEDLLLESTFETDREMAAAALASIVLDTSDEYLIRQIAARDLEFYPNTPEVGRLLSIVLNPEEDLDIRVNLVAGFRRWRSSLLKRIAAEIQPNDELARYV